MVISHPDSHYKGAAPFNLLMQSDAKFSIVRLFIRDNEALNTGEWILNNGNIWNAETSFSKCG